MKQAFALESFGSWSLSGNRRALLAASLVVAGVLAGCGDGGGGGKVDGGVGDGSMQDNDAAAGGDDGGGDSSVDPDPGEIPAAGGAVLTINSGNGMELTPGESFAMPLYAKFGSGPYAGYYSILTEDDEVTPNIVSISHTHVVTGEDGDPVFNGDGEYESIWVELQEFPLAVGSYLCQGQAPNGDPDSDIRVELSHEWYDPETAMSRGTDSLVSTENLAGTTNCQLEITSVADGIVEGTVTASLRNYAGLVDQLVGITYTFRAPVPVCTTDDPFGLTCIPWAE